MSEKKNIDRLFQEKFKDYEVFPDPNVWENIEKQLKKKKKRRIVPLWLRFAGAAAVLLLLVSSGYWYFNKSDKTPEMPEKSIITDTDNSESEDSEATPIIEQNTTEPQRIIVTESKKELVYTPRNKPESSEKKTVAKDMQFTNVVEQSTMKNDVNSDTNISENKNKISDEKLNQMISTEIKEKRTISKNQKDIVKETSSDIQKVIEEEAAIVKDEEPSDKKWSVGSSIAPVYYNSFSNGSPIDASLAGNDKNTINSVSYGLKVNYKLTDKLSLQSGINTVELGYSTENVATLLSSSLLDDSSSNIDTNIEGVSVATVSTASQNVETLNSRSSFDVNGTLDQTMSYVEVPLEAKYSLLQKKVGISVVGGFSTYVLYQNRIHQTSFGKRTVLGEASNLNSLNFSGNFGVDFDYNISKSIYINISPMLKYQFNTFSENSGGFQPYYFGVYTGFNFRF